MRAEMNQHLAAMPPEPRRQMQQMMAAQGVSLGAGGEIVSKQCITREMIERVDGHGVPPDAGPYCTCRNGARRGHRWSFGSSCMQPTRSGEGGMTFRSDGACDSAMTMKQARHGETEVMTLTSSSRYLGSDCGSLKPAVDPARTAPFPPASKTP